MEYFASPDDIGLSYGKKVTQFSDSLLISFPITSDGELWNTLADLQLLIINLVNRNMLCRGAITIGKLYHDKYVFGPALIEAYKLESKVAYYPRVILGEKVIEAGKNAHYFIHTPEEEEDYIKSLLDQDEDGLYFIDYFYIGEKTLIDPKNFPIYLDTLRKTIINGLKIKERDIRVKYLWMASKFNKTIDYIRANIELHDPRLRDRYLKISKIRIEI